MGAPKMPAANAGGQSRKRASQAQNTPAPKRLRKDENSDNAGGKPQAGERNLPAVSILQEERKAFARGGGGVLSPFELKNIQRQAQQDVMFEETGQKSARTKLGSDDEDMIDPDQEEQPKKKRRKSKSKKATDSKDETEANIKVAALTPKRMIPGDTVLGRVSRVTASELVLDLPNNLTGHVPLTAISSKLSERIDDMLKEQEDLSDKDIDEDDDIQDVDLKEVFTIGQYLRASLLGEDEKGDALTGAKHRRKLFSLDPRLTNKGLSASNLAVNSSVMAAVRSVEDHGLVMDLGLGDDQVKGFMSSREIPDDVDYSDIRQGAVLLCLVTGVGSNGKVIKLSANHKKVGDTRKGNVLIEASTVGSFLPGTAAEMLVSQVTETTVAGKILGSVNATIDVLHSGAHFEKVDLTSKYPVGSKLKARIIYSCGDEGNRTLGMSLLRHAMSLSAPATSHGEKAEAGTPSAVVPIGSTWDETKVVQVEPGLGLYVDIGVRGLAGFVHISRVSDTRVSELSDSSGSFKVGTVHKARVLGYSSLDNLILMSMEKSVLEQPFIRIEDVKPGELVKGTVDQIIVKEKGVAGVLLKLTTGINGFVPESHMSDIHLQHPERKFRQGVPFTARVLSVNAERRRISLTLKKSLVNTDLSIWTDYNQIKPGSEAAGTIFKLTKAGAILKFYGNVRAFLPASQMSDTFVEDPTTHFQLGQVLRVRAISVDSAARRMTVSSRVLSEDEETKISTHKSLKIGQIVKGSISSKSTDDVTIDLDDLDLQGTLRIGHFSDGSVQKNASIMKQFRIGQNLTDLVIIELFPKRNSVVLSNKPALLKIAKSGQFARNVEELKAGITLAGFIRNITSKEIFVQTLGGVIGLLPKSQLPEQRVSQADFGYRKDESISARVLTVSTDGDGSRFVLTMKEQVRPPMEKLATAPEDQSVSQVVLNPIDGRSKSLSDYAIGKTTTAKIVSVKKTQLNVKLADNLQGRIDVSEAFARWEEITDRRNPLKSFNVDQELHVRVLGLHDARNHRFLPISHRTTTMKVFELSAKLETPEAELSYQNISVGSSHLAFVNSHKPDCLWVNVSPNVRGLIARIDASDDVSSLNNLERSFPVGSALRVRVKAIDAQKNHLDLTARTASRENELTIERLSVSTILPGKITKVSERAVTVQLSKDVVGQVGLTELADDFEQANPSAGQKNQIVRVAVLDIDQPNKRVTLSTRPSKVLSSSLPVKDPSISKVGDLKVGDVVRGFIKEVADIGLFVNIGYKVTAFVRVSELSDSFIKDWKSQFEVDRLVIGRITTVDEPTQKVQMSLKESVTAANYVAPLTFNDVTVGQVVTGKVRKVEDFGAFIVADNSQNVSGLCHRSEIADHRVHDVRKLYNEGDAVKAVVLKIEPEKRRISFGLKASYFDIDSDNAGSDDEEEHGGVVVADEEEEDSEGQGFDIGSAADDDSEESDDLNIDEDGDSDADSGSSVEDLMHQDKQMDGIDPGGFDWNGTTRPINEDDNESQLGEEATSKPTKPKKKSAKIQLDQTGSLNEAPKTSTDFERLLLTDRDDSALWMQYMAFHLGLGEIDAARAIAERALREININEQGEKQNIWVAWLNLEIEQGTRDSLEEVFKRACETQDKIEMHEKLASIYISAGQAYGNSDAAQSHFDKADDVYQSMIKKKLGTASPRFWANYEHFLLSHRENPPPARELLDRAMQSVPDHAHLELIKSFALLQFKTAKADGDDSSTGGNPELGRTLFEGLVNLYPKRGDLWDVWLEMEMVMFDKGNGLKEQVRDLFDRMVSVKGLKARRAKYVFKRWLEWEQKHGGPKMVEKVKAKTAEWVKKKQEEGNANEED